MLESVPYARHQSVLWGGDRDVLARSCASSLPREIGDQEVTVDIETGAVTGAMSKRALAMVDEWRLLHIDELREDWRLATTRQSLRRIEPLE